MSKTKKKKARNMNRSEYRKFFNDLSHYGFETYDIRYNDGYWTDEDKDCNVSFKIKGLDRWVFGCWKQTPDDWDKRYKLPYHLCFFCQFEQFIDKFKPSYSKFTTDVHIACYLGEPEEGEQRDYFDLWEVENIIKFMMKYEAVAYCCNDLYDYVPVWKAKWIMFRDIHSDNRFQRKKNRLQKRLIKYCKLFKRLGWAEYAYRKDGLNEGMHINDYYYLWTKNKFVKFLCNRIEDKTKYYLDIGCFWSYDDELHWRLACCESYIPKEEVLTEQEIEDLIDDLKDEMKYLSKTYSTFEYEEVN